MSTHTIYTVVLKDRLNLSPSRVIRFMSEDSAKKYVEENKSSLWELDGIYTNKWGTTA